MTSTAGPESPLYTVQATPDYLQRYHHAQFSGYGPPVATAIPHRHGSDCGSSSGLGGMKDPPSLAGNASDDSGDHDAASDELPSEGAERSKCTVKFSVSGKAQSSSKQSAASSSGKGSSTGTSPTGGNVKLRSPKRALHHHHHYRHSAHSSLPSTSSAQPSSVSEPLDGPTPSASLLNGNAGEFTPSAPFHRPQELPIQPLMPPGAQLIVTSNPAMGAQGPSATAMPPPPLYTMTVGVTGQFEVLNPVGPMSNVRQQMARSNSSSPYSPTPNNHPNGPPQGSGGSGPGSGQGSHKSASPPVVNGSSSAPPGPAPPPAQQHAVFVHVHGGETLSVRVGNDVQQIHGPATVRMVSQSVVPPFPLPLHVPLGTVVQQIVDENGVLRHLILSPQSAVGPMANGPFAPPAPQPAGPQGVASPVPPAFLVPANSITPPPNVFPPFAVVPPFNAQQDAQTQETPVTNDVSYQTYPSSRPNSSRWSPPNSKVHRPPRHRTEEGYISEAMEPGPLDNSRDDSRSGTSANEDEDREIMGLKEMLSRIQPVQVCEIGPREVLVQWQQLDTSEASACGGPYPQLDNSEFAYDLVLSEGKPEGTPYSHYRCQVDQSPPQLRLCHLNPNTDYFVRLMALLPERNLGGEPSPPIGFKTKPSHPDKPYPPRLLKRGKTWFILHWKRPCDNGAKITNYHLECDEARDDRPSNYRVVYEGTSEQNRVSKLEPNTLYRFRLSASNQHGKSEESDILMVQTNGAAPTTPEPPQLLQASSSSLQLAWQKRAGDDQFTLQMEDPNSGHGFLNASVTPETVTTVHGLQRNSNYNFRLVAQNEDGKSQPSASVTYKTLASKPQAPNKPYLKDRVKSSSVRLSWDAPRDTGGAEVSSYQLEYCVDPLSSRVAASPRQWETLYSGSERDYTVTALDPGCGYQFRLSCVGPAGQSPYSDPFQVCTTCVPPDKCNPPEVVGKPKPNAISLRWSCPSSTGGSDVTDYELSMNESELYSGPKHEHTATQLSPGSVYSFRLRAHNQAGAGRWSDALDAQTAPGAPSTPHRPQCTHGNNPNTLVLCWQTPTHSNGAPVTEYRLLKAVKRLMVDGSPPWSSVSSEDSLSSSPSSDSDLAQFTQCYAGQATTHELKALAPATQFAFKVIAVNSAGASAPSPTLVCRTPAGAPESPSHVRAEATSTSELRVSWDEANSNGSPLTVFEVALEHMENESDTRVDRIEATNTTHLCQGLAPETAYKLRVRAVNEVGVGAWSCALRACTLSRPPPPPSLELVAASHNTLKVRWQDNKTPANNETYSYNLEVQNKSGSYSPVYEGPSRSHKVVRLSECTQYALRVRAVSSSGGVGSWSESRCFITTRAPPPALKAAPRLTEACAGSWQVEWTAVKPVGLAQGDKIQYLLQMVAGGRDEWKNVYQGAAQSYTLSGLATGQSYRVRVLPVRISSSNEETVETMGQASAVAAFSTQPTATKRPSIETVSEGVLPSDELVECEGSRGMSDAHWAILILLGFSLIALLLAGLVQWFLMDD